MRLVVLIVLFLAPLPAFANSGDIVGTWLTEDGSGKINIFKCKNKYCGKTTWIKPTKKVPHPENKKDVHNPNPQKRDRLLLGATIMWGLSYDAENKEWQGGFIYDSRRGKVYKCKIQLKDNRTLLLRGFVGFSLIGQTTHWTRVK